MKLKFSIISFIIFLSINCFGGNVVYERQDSVKIVSLLRKAASLPRNTNRMVWFGKQFIGVPYVGGTLEVTDREKLVVNTRELDCTTFVETVLALTIADEHDCRSFTGFCKALEKVRYRGGKMKGYDSRLHYFAFWVDDNEKLGLVKDVLSSSTPYVRKQTLYINFMSQNSEKYPHLKGNGKMIEAIARYEKEFEGNSIWYLPKDDFNLSSKQLPFIKSGDIIGLVTKRKGLDTSHLGIAVWQKGKLHMLNASYIYKKVVLDRQTLYKYGKKQSTQLGMRVIRAK